MSNHHPYSDSSEPWSTKSNQVYSLEGSRIRTTTASEHKPTQVSINKEAQQSEDRLETSIFSPETLSYLSGRERQAGNTARS